MRTLLVLLLCTSTAFAGGSRDFDESGDCIAYGSDFDPAGGDGTIAIWVNGDEAGADAARVVSNLVDGGALPSEGYTLTKRSGANQEKLGCLVSMNSAVAHREASPTTASFNDGVWRFVLCDFTDGTTASVNLFVDNMVTADVSVSGNFGAYVPSANGATRIGSEGGSCTLRNWDGRLAHLQIFDRVLTERERHEIMFMPGFELTNLVLHSPLFSPDGSTEVDLSGNGNTGTVTGALESNEGPPIFYPGSL